MPWKAPIPQEYKTMSVYFQNEFTDFDDHIEGMHDIVIDDAREDREYDERLGYTAIAGIMVQEHELALEDDTEYTGNEWADPDMVCGADTPQEWGIKPEPMDDNSQVWPSAIDYNTIGE